MTNAIAIEDPRGTVMACPDDIAEANGQVIHLTNETVKMTEELGYLEKNVLRLYEKVDEYNDKKRKCRMTLESLASLL